MTNYATQPRILVHNLKFSAFVSGVIKYTSVEQHSPFFFSLVNYSVCFGVHIPIFTTSDGFFHRLYRVCISNVDIPQHCCPGECEMSVQNCPVRHHFHLSHQHCYEFLLLLLLLNPIIKVKKLYNCFSLFWVNPRWNYTCVFFFCHYFVTGYFGRNFIRAEVKQKEILVMYILKYFTSIIHSYLVKKNVWMYWEKCFF